MKLLITSLISLMIGFASAYILIQSPTTQVTLSSSDPEIERSSLRDSPIGLRRSQRTMQNSDNVELTIVQALRSRDAAIADVIKGAKGFLTNADRDRIKEIEEASDARIEQLLGPEAYQKHLIDKFKLDPFGTKVLNNFKASEVEVTAICNYMNAQSKLELRDDWEAEQQRNESALKAALGDERFQKFMNFQDPAYNETLAFAQRYGIDASKANELIELSHEAVVANHKLNQSGANPDEISRLLSENGLSIRNRLIQLVGEEAASSYIENSQYGHWVK